MDEETQNNQENTTPNETTELGSTPMGEAPEPIRVPDPVNTEKPRAVPEPSISGAQSRLVQEIAKDTNVQKKQAGGEDTFIDFASQENSALTDALAPVAEKLTKIPEKRKESIRTYQSDVESTIRNQKLSLTNIAIAENQQRIKKGTPKTTQTNKAQSGIFKKVLLNIVSAFILSSAVGVFAFLYLNYQKNRALPETFGPTVTLALANKNLTLDVTGMDRDMLLAKLAELAEHTEATIGDVTNITLVSGTPPQQITLSAFLHILEADADPALLRSIENEFMLGLHSFDKGYFFLIAKTSFFENAFAGMLRWEDTIATELPFLVRTVPPPVQPQNLDVGTASTSSSTNILRDIATTSTSSLPVVPKEAPVSFEDIVIENKDVRAHYSSSGDIDMLYTFVDPETLIITTNTNTMKAVLDRLTIARFKQ